MDWIFTGLSVLLFALMLGLAAFSHKLGDKPGVRS